MTTLLWTRLRALFRLNLSDALTALTPTIPRRLCFGDGASLMKLYPDGFAHAQTFWASGLCRLQAPSCPARPAFYRHADRRNQSRPAMMARLFEKPGFREALRLRWRNDRILSSANRGLRIDSRRTETLRNRYPSESSSRKHFH